MLHRSLIVLTSALTFGTIFIYPESAKAQCYTNDLQCWLDYSDQVLDEANQRLEQLESQGEYPINHCLQSDRATCYQLLLKEQIDDIKQESFQDTACMPYCN